MYLGIDIGSSAVKVVLVDEEGRIVRLSVREVASHSPQPDFFEQDAEEAWRAVKEATQSCLSASRGCTVKAAGFSSAMHGLLALDDAGRPLIRQITWADNRAGPQTRKLSERHAAQEVYQRTGCPLSGLYFPAKLCWLREEVPEVFQRARWFCSIKDWIISRITGRLVMDRSQASSHGLLNLRSGEWDDLALEMAGISAERLPELCPPDSLLEGLLPEGQELFSGSGIMVAPGAGDGGLANLGTAAVTPGEAAVTIGTSGAMRLISDKPMLDPRMRTWCYYLTEGLWYAGGAINSGGIVSRWVRDRLFPEAAAAGDDGASYEAMIRLAAAVPPGSEGLIFLPYLIGERTPLWDPLARGVLFGLRPGHTRAHIARAAMEGTCFAMAGVRKALEESAAEIRLIRASGGFFQSSLGIKILADVLGKEIVVPESQQGSALGAAFLAMKAAGRFRRLSEVQNMVPTAYRISPEPAVHELYQKMFVVFEDLYPRLRESFVNLHRLFAV